MKIKVKSFFKRDDASIIYNILIIAKNHKKYFYSAIFRLRMEDFSFSILNSL